MYVFWCLFVLFFAAISWSWWTLSTILKTTSQKATTTRFWPTSTRQIQTSSRDCNYRPVTCSFSSVRSGKRAILVIVADLKCTSKNLFQWFKYVLACTPSGRGGNGFGFHRVHRGHHQDAHFSSLGCPLLHHALLSRPLNYVWEHWGSGGSFARPQGFAQILAQRNFHW